MTKRHESLRVSLERKLTAVSLLTAAVTLLLAVVAFSVWEWIESREEVAAELQLVSKLVARNSSAALLFEDDEEAQEALSSLSASRQVVEAVIFLADGTPFARYSRADNPSTPVLELPLPTEVRFHGNRVRYNTEVVHSGDVIGYLAIEVVDDARRAALYQYSVITLAIFALAVGCAIPLSSALQRLVSQPLLKLAALARQVSQTRDYSLRAERTTADETGLLVDAFNEMLAEIQSYSQDNSRHLRELKSSKDFAQSTLDALPTCVAILDGNGVIESVNQAWGTEILKATPVVRCDVGENYLDCCAKAGAAGVADAIQRVLRLESHQASLEHSVGDSQAARWFFTQVTRFQIGETVHIIVSHSEITDRKLLEEKSMHSQKMQAVGSLAGGVAHDFNNLLTIINGYSDLLLTHEPSNSPNWLMAEQIREAGRRAAALTAQLLVFSRKQIFQPKIIDLNEVVDNTRNLVERLIGEHIEFRVLKGAHLQPIEADQGRIEQVIMNLCVNSRDAMPNGGSLTIETGRASVDEAMAATDPTLSPGDYVVLSVVDTGVGMDRKLQARIFEPFFTSKATGKGSGLGLSTVYGIVKQSNGYIRLNSRPGRGTSFEIYFPAKDGSPSETAVSPKPSLSRGTETILVVEDEVRLRELVSSVLTGSGYEVFTAGDGQEALEVVAKAERPIDLVVTDVVMPRLNGVEMSKQLLLDRPELRILFVSGYTDVDLSTLTRRSSNLQFLNKPFSPSVLSEKVRELLESKTGILTEPRLVPPLKSKPPGPDGITPPGGRPEPAQFRPAMTPPSTSQTTPVTQPASSESKKSTVAATSSA